ncbi:MULTISPECIES: hypothetical protein [Microbacterium]|uniref:hypothetical protein n=1 Tax=Microbacterium TaxID=33882 RepID=UPI0013A59501|nr:MULTISPECIES: hypothetical protein [Microbacterium]
MTEPRRTVGAVGLGMLLLLTGCAAPPAPPVPTPTWVDLSSYDPARDGNGVALLQPSEARAQILSDMAGSATVMTVAFRDAAGRTLDVAYSGAPGSFSADVTVDGQTTSIVVDGDTAAVTPAAAVAVPVGLEPGAVACVTASDDLVTRWHPLLDPAALVADASADASGIGAPAEGAIELLLGDEGTAGILRVSTTGRALPSELLRTDETGSLDARFTDWGEAAPGPMPAGC